MQSTRSYTAIGVMSGTSMDGIDVALVRTDGVNVFETGPSGMTPYPEALRRSLLALIADPARCEHDALTDLEADVTAAHAKAVQQFIVSNNLTHSEIDVVGLHGQTIIHKPKQRFTRQLCDGVLAARMLGMNCVTRFRHADVASGGEGAPLVPVYHQALAREWQQPLMVLNLGGVANVTYLDGATVIAFDTGPASALIDDFCLRRTGQPFDRDGVLAAQGKADAGILGVLLADPYFMRQPPKSLDRQHFKAKAAEVENLSDADGAATLTAFTIESIAAALAHVPRAPLRWLVGGGGRLNGSLMHGLSRRLGVSVEPVEAAGWNGDTLEAECFGFLAVRSLLGLPLSFPGTTGVPAPMSGGEIWRAR